MSKRTRLTAAVGVCGLACGVASAQTWNTDANGNWGVAGNWLPMNVPNGAAADAVMGNVVTAARTVTLNINPQLNSLSFSTQNNDARYIIDGNAALLFRGNANALTVANNNRGNHEIWSGIDISASDLTITNGNIANGSVAIFGPVTQANNVARKIFVKGGGRVGFFGKVATTGGIEIDGGQLAFFRNESLGGGNAGLSMKNKADLILLPDPSLANQPQSITVNRAIVMANQPRFFQVVGAPELILGGVLSGNASPFFAGDISFTNNNTFTGTPTLGGGVYGIGSDQAFGNAANRVRLQLVELKALNNFNSARSFDIEAPMGVNTNGKNVTLSGAIVGTLAPNTNAGLFKLGAGTLTLSGNNGFDGVIDIIGGTLSISKAANLGTAPLVRLSGGTLQTTDTFALPQDFALPNGISSIDVAANKTLSLGKVSGGGAANPTGVLNKIGAGNLEINDTDGKKIKRVNVNAGTLGLGGGGVLDSIDGLFVDNAKVKGTGKVTGPVQFTSKAKVKPGNSPGTLTFEGPTLFVGSNTFEIDINSAVGVAGGTLGWGLLNVTDTLTLTALPSDPMVVELVSLSTSNLNSPLADFDASQFYSWTFAVAGGGIVGFDASAWTVDVSDFRNSLEGGSFAVVQFGNELRLEFTPIPAPGALAVLGLAALAGRRRRESV